MLKYIAVTLISVDSLISWNVIPSESFGPVREKIDITREANKYLTSYFYHIILLHATSFILAKSLTGEHLMIKL